MRSLELTPQYLDEGLSNWLRNMALAAVLAAGGEQTASKKSTTEPGKITTANTVTNSVSPQNSLIKVKADTPAERKNLLKKMAVAAGIQGAELLQFLAQSSHETRNFEALEETGSVPYLERKYGSGRRKGTILGNTRPGDGARFRGRGFLQLTGKYNYHQIGKMINLDLVNNPGLVSKYPGVAAATAIAYWKWRVAPRVKSFTDASATEKITRQVTGVGAEKHLNRRKAQLKHLQKKP